MRGIAPVLLASSLFLLLVSPVRAEVTPVPIWPSSELRYHDAALNLTTWFADKLNVQVDHSTSGEWKSLEPSGLPEGVQERDAFILPLMDGHIEARYFSSGILANIQLVGNTSYLAESDQADDLRLVVVQIVTVLGLNASKSLSFTEVVVLNEGTPQEETYRLVTLKELTDFGSPYNFNSISVSFRMPELRVVRVRSEAWYQSSGIPVVTTDAAVTFARLSAESEHNATEAYGTSFVVAVWNGTSYVYLVQTYWDVGRDSTYALDQWVDTNSGEVLGERGPEIIVVDSYLSIGNWLWAILTIPAVTLVVGLAMFYRISSERALDHFNRGRIFGYIQANPGVTYTMIREALGLTNGTVAYHLWVLERLGFVKTARKGRVKQFYPEGVSLSRGSLILTRLQYSILDALKAGGPLTQAEIAKSLDMSRQRAHYNVRVLNSLDLVRITEDGDVKLTYKGEESIAEGESGLFVTAEHPLPSGNERAS